MRSTRQADPSDLSLPCCEILEQEYAAITGEKPDPALSWEFTATQILEPDRLASRLIDGHDRAANGLKQHEFSTVVKELVKLAATDDRPARLALLTNALNSILEDRQLYVPGQPGHFDGVRFRSQTMDQIALGASVQRNRLILEDAFPEVQKLDDVRLARIYRKIHEKKFAALCLSGGGIRSATFALGVVQGLARNDLLDKFQYLSTVSGGGYLGGWLSAWIRHTSLPHVVDQLRAPTGRPFEPEAEPIWHLRTYSNYLSPRLGLLSADSWTLVATYLRNLFLNWLVLVPLLVGVLAIPLLLSAIVAWYPERVGSVVQTGLGLVLGVIAFGCGALAVHYVHANRPEALGKTEGTGLDDRKRGQRDFLSRCLLPLLVAVLFSTILLAWSVTALQGELSEISWGVFAGLGALVHLCGWLPSAHPGREVGWPRFLLRLAREGIVIAVAGAAAGFAVWILARLVPGLLNRGPLGPVIYACLAVPVFLAVILVFSHLYIGYTSGRQVDAAREWSARYSAWILIIIAAWLGTFGLVLWGPIALGRLFEYLRSHAAGALPALKTIVGAIGVVSGAVTLWMGQGEDTAGSPRSAKAPMSLALSLAAPTFVISLVVLLGWLAHRTVDAVEHALTPSYVPALVPNASIGAILIVAGGLIGFSIGTALFVDTNKFSLHAMYRARLIRAFLGASRPAGERDPNRFTGFDDADNLPMRDLWPAPGSAPSPPGGRPLHVVNVALNLVGGSKLAWQERKAESFTFSPLHCGSHSHGYRPTRQPDSKSEPAGYGGDRGVSLGTAITISGAAVSPNMGYHSSPVISLLLTLFNVRLGWWLGNPGYAGRKVYTRSAPRSSLGRIVDEALARTDDHNPYVYLSDGGHFENLGLYEMVLRRCHTIVVSDGGCDPSCAFEDLGNAIRKIRIDFGIPIEFEEILIYARENGGPARPGKYGAIGKIHYSRVDPGADDGTLIYLKPAFYGAEPMDVFNYARTSMTFPHETTGDQFFSESQFESYRALGSHVVDQILISPPPTGDPFAGTPSLGRLAWLTSDYVHRRRVPTGDGAGTAPTGNGGD
jgi:hypothetical protein